MADSVEIRLGADVSRAIAGLNAFSSVAKTTVLAAAAAFGALTKSAIDAADQMGKAAQKAGQAVETFSQFAFVGSLADASIEELGKGFKELSKNIVLNNKAFDELGIARLTKDGTFRDASDVLLDISDKLAGMRDGVNKVTYATELFGKAGQNLIPLLNQGRDAIKAQMEEAKALGVVIDEKLSSQSQEFNDNLTRMGAGLKGIGLDIARAVLPNLIEMSKAVVQLTKDIRENDLVTKSWGIFKKTQDIVGAGAEAFVAAFSGQTWKDTIETLKSIGRETKEGWEAAGGAAALKAKITVEDYVRTLSKELQLKHELSVIEALRSDGANEFGISEAEKNSRELAFLEIKYDKLQKIRAEIEKSSVPGSISDLNHNEGDPVSEEAKAYNEKLLPVLKEVADAQEKIKQAKTQNSFAASLRVDLVGLQNQIGTFSQASAKFVTNGIGAAFNGLSDGIYGAVTGTKSWGEAWAEVGQQVLKMFINLIVQAIELFVILELLNAIIPGFGNLLAASAGAAGGISSAASAGSRASGGPVSNGLYNLGEQGTEYVVNAPTLQKYGQGYFDALQAGSTPPAQGGAPTNIKMAFINEGSAYHDFLQSSDGEKIVVDIMSRNIHHFR